MTVDLDAALADADSVTDRKLAAGLPVHARTPVVAGAGPDRPMPYIAAFASRELFVDTTYQRPVDHTRVRAAAEAWDPTMLGVLEVSDRGPDTSPRYAIVNGQHRRAIAVLADPRGDDVPLVCNVHRGLSPTDEAALMYELDRGTKALTSWDRWRARTAAGDPVVVEVNAVAAKHGLSVTPGVFGAIGAAEKIVRAHGRKHLDAVVTVLTAAYGASPAALKSPMLTGLSSFLVNHGEDVVVERLVDALGKTTPQEIRAAADALREVDGGTLNALVTRTIAGRYNRTLGPRPRLADTGR